MSRVWRDDEPQPSSAIRGIFDEPFEHPSTASEWLSRLAVDVPASLTRSQDHEFESTYPDGRELDEGIKTFRPVPGNAPIEVDESLIVGETLTDQARKRIEDAYNNTPPRHVDGQ